MQFSFLVDVPCNTTTTSATLIYKMKDGSKVTVAVEPKPPITVWTYDEIKIINMSKDKKQTVMSNLVNVIKSATNSARKSKLKTKILQIVKQAYTDFEWRDIERGE